MDWLTVLKIIISSQPCQDQYSITGDLICLQVMHWMQLVM